MIPGEKRAFGGCNLEVDSPIRRVEPPEAVQGDIARTIFSREDTYGFNLSWQDEQSFTVWSRKDPLDAWEIERDRRIQAIPGQGNRFVEDYAALLGKAATAPAAPAPVVPTPTAPAPVAPAPAASASTTHPSSWVCGTQHGDKDLGRVNLAGSPIDHRGGLAGLVDQ